MRPPPSFVVECKHCGALTRRFRTLMGARQAGQEHLTRCRVLHPPQAAEPEAEQLGLDLEGKDPPA